MEIFLGSDVPELGRLKMTPLDEEADSLHNGFFFAPAWVRVPGLTCAAFFGSAAFANGLVSRIAADLWDTSTDQPRGSYRRCSRKAREWTTPVAAELGAGVLHLLRVERGYALGVLSCDPHPRHGPLRSTGNF